MYKRPAHHSLPPNPTAPPSVSPANVVPHGVRREKLRVYQVVRVYMWYDDERQSRREEKKKEVRIRRGGRQTGSGEENG